jgi:hypothetical protein
MKRCGRQNRGLVKVFSVLTAVAAGQANDRLRGPSLEHFHFFFNAPFELLFLGFKVIACLKVQPETLRKAEVAQIGRASCRERVYVLV